MKTRLLAAALAVVMCACSKPPESPTTAQGSVGATKDDALVFAADTDTNQVFVFDTATEKLVATVNVGPSPEKVLVGKDDTIYVTNRMGRSVSVIRRGEWTEAKRLEVGVEPVSMAMSADGRTLYVVSSTSLTTSDFGTLTAIDTATLTPKWELPVGREPRGLVLLENDRAMVTLFKDGDVALVDLAGQKVLRNSTDLHQALNASKLQGQTGFNKPTGTGQLSARAVDSLVASPDGRSVYATARLSTDTVLQAPCAGLNCDPSMTSPSQDPSIPGGGSGSEYGSGGIGGGSCTGSSVSSPALLSFDPSGSPQIDDLVTCQQPNSDHPPTQLASGNSTIPIQGPSAAVIDPSGAFVYVVNHDSNNVAIVSTVQRGSNNQNFGFGAGRSTVQNVVSVGAGPTGIVLTKAGTNAWVYNGFDHSLSLIVSDNGVPRTTKTIALGKDVLPADVVAGRKLFFNANDSRMTDPKVGLSCGTCHLEGREDGHVWNFSTGPRQTPTLAGRMLEKTAPLHWDGEFQGMGDLSHAITGRMGGEGITEAMGVQISAYLASLPAADNANRLAQKTPAQLRGAQVFTKAQCNSCHTGEALTNNGFANVGTLVQFGVVQDDAARLPKGLNTPSLLGLSRTAPYLHDGSATTIKARILQGQAGNLHGLTASLSTGEVDDLVAYLETL